MCNKKSIIKQGYKKITDPLLALSALYVRILYIRWFKEEGWTHFVDLSLFVLL